MSGARAADLLERELPAAVLRREAAFGEETVWVDRDSLVAACTLLRDHDDAAYTSPHLRDRRRLARPRARRAPIRRRVHAEVAPAQRHLSPDRPGQGRRSQRAHARARLRRDGLARAGVLRPPRHHLHRSSRPQANPAADGLGRASAAQGLRVLWRADRVHPQPRVGAAGAGTAARYAREDRDDGAAASRNRDCTARPAQRAVRGRPRDARHRARA